MNNQEYWTEVRNCTIDLVNQVIIDLVEHEGLPLTADLIEEHINDNGLINELVDGHQFIIYTHEALQVMEHTDNSSYLTDNIGDIERGLDWNTIVTRFAYWAMYGDIMDALSDIIESEVNDYLEKHERGIE